MNAPWKPSGTAAVNEPFSAFVCDDTTLEVLRNVVVEMGWPLEKCHRGGLRNAVQTLAVSASPDILLIDLSESGDPINDINALAEVCEPGTVVIALGQINDVRLYRDLLSSGLQDYLLKPITEDQLRESLQFAQTQFNAPIVTEDENLHKHASITVMGTRGGIGTTTVATSIAWQMSKAHDRLTALLDLDVHFGTGALTMDLEPGRGLTDAIDNPSRIDGLFIERAMIKANDKLAILSAEAPINNPINTDGSAYFHLQDEFSQAFACTVTDVPRHVMINFPQLFNDSDVIILVTDFTLASARDTIRIMSWLKNNAAQAKIMIVANKVQSAIQEISRKDFETSIEHKVDYILPYDAKATCQAAKMGQTLTDAVPNSKASKALVQLSNQCLKHVDGEIIDLPNGAKKNSAGLLDGLTSLFSGSKDKEKSKK